MATADFLEDIDDYGSATEPLYAVQVRRETASLVVVGAYPTTYLSSIGMHPVAIPSGFQEERHRRYLRLCILRRRYYRLNAIYE
jgi:hypothetical protein